MINVIKLFRLNASIYHMYGATETGMVFIHRIFPGKQVHSFTVTNFEKLKIRDVTSKNVLGPDKNGEICVKGRNVMKGYYGNPEATKLSFDEDGFYLTGDVGYCDLNGRIHIVERIKDIIKYKAFQVIIYRSRMLGEK